MVNTKRISIEISAVNRELQKVLNEGNVQIGSKETIKAFMKKEAKVIIHASTCPERIKKVFKDADNDENEKPLIYEYPANSLELGLACGKPYAVASLCITDTGNSEIVRLLGSNTKPKEKSLRITTR